MKKLFLTAGLALCLVGCQGTPKEQTPDPSTPPVSTTEKAAQAPSTFSFHGKNRKGEAVDSSILEASPVTFVNLWGTFCRPCLHEMPELERLAKEYEGRIQVLGITTDVPAEEDPSHAEDLLQQMGITYPVVYPSMDSLYQEPLASTTVLPTSYFVNKEGKILSEPILGMHSYEQWKVYFDDILAKQQ